MSGEFPPRPPAPAPVPAPRPRSVVVPLLLGVALVALAIVAIQRASRPPGGGSAEASANPRGKVLADFGEVVDFEFVDQHGRPFTKRDLAGRVWVVDFFFTSCPGPCVELTTRMRSLAAALAAEPDVGFISVSVDPATDTPDALARYAAAMGGGSERWRWLTGDLAQVQKLARNFLAALGEKDASGDISHSTRLHVIDRAGHLRAIHDTQLADEWKPATLHSVRLLLEQPAPAAAPAADPAR